MPFSNHPPADAGDKQIADSIIAGRYALLRCMAETALGKVYWACDRQHPQATPTECSNLLVFTVLPALAQNSVFEQALRQVLPAYQQDAPSQPHVIDNGKEPDGTRWLALKNIKGMLLAERLQELDDRGMPQPLALDILHGLSEAIGNHRPQGVFGFLEPGAVLADEQGYCLLSAPIVTALRLASTGTIAHPNNRQTFHSGFISPEVALGDQAISRDDTFSLACIAYNLLQGHPPFGTQTTLEAAVRNFAPPSISKLTPSAWAALQQGLNLKREGRQATPPALLTGLQTRQRPRLLLPVAAISLASVVAYASYQWLANSDDTTTVVPQDVTLSNPTLSPANEGSSVPTTAPSLVGESSAPAALDQESVQAARDKLAAEATAKTEEADRYDAIKREAEMEARAELAAAETAKREALQNKAEAEALQREAQLEAKTVEPTTPERGNITPYIERTNRAIEYGNLMQGNDQSGSAIGYVNALFDAFPNNPEGINLIKKIVGKQHEQATTALRKRNTDAARQQLNDSQKLIGQYMLDDLVEEQLALEKRYRDVEMMRIVPSGDELPNKPGRNVNESRQQPTTPQQADTNKPGRKGKPEEKPTAAPIAATEKKPEAAAATPAQTPVAPPPVEPTPAPSEKPPIENAAPPSETPMPVQEETVPPDVPVAEVPATPQPIEPAEMQPIQIDAQTPPPQAEPIPEPAPPAPAVEAEPDVQPAPPTDPATATQYDIPADIGKNAGDNTAPGALNLPEPELPFDTSKEPAPAEIKEKPSIW
jgi:serine/threonine protein kinase